MWKVHIFSNISGLIDDVYTFNNDELENDYKDIWPDELELKKENEDPCTVVFELFNGEVIENLELSCLIKEMRFFYTLIACPVWQQ